MVRPCPTATNGSGPRTRPSSTSSAPNEPQHIAAITVFEAGRLARPDGGVDIERVRAYVGSRLHRLPRYRQRLAWIPVEQHPVWVDDPHFQIDYHVRHTALPRPGDERQLKRLAGRVISQPLDRERPLWEFWVVEGLEGGKRFAIVQKVHHCMIDGISGVDLMAILLAVDPEAEPEPSPPFEPRPTLSPLDLLASEVGRRVTGLVGVLGRTPGALRTPADLAERVREGVAAVSETLSAALRPASDTPDQPEARAAPARRLARPRALAREGREGPPRRHRERRGARDGGGRAAPVPGVAPPRRGQPAHPRERAR